MSKTAIDTADKPEFYLTEEHHPENSTMLGFWLYLMSDCLIFAILFATYAVLGRNYAAGPSPADLFDLPLVAINTSMLLLSSITYGFAMLQMERAPRRPKRCSGLASPACSAPSSSGSNSMSSCI
jgi:cytochrome o ubiquinol oxidase subunit 3